MRQDDNLLAEKGEEKDRMDIWATHRMKTRSVKRMFYWNSKNGVRKSGLFYAIVGDAIALEKQWAVMLEVASVLGYEVKPRREVTDWRYRRSPKIKVAGSSYCLILKDGGGRKPL